MSRLNKNRTGQSRADGSDIANTAMPQVILPCDELWDKATREQKRLDSLCLALAAVSVPLRSAGVVICAALEADEKRPRREVVGDLIEAPKECSDININGFE